MLGFILGSGVSLSQLDPNLISQYPKICVNSAICKFPNADYLVCCDARFTCCPSWDTLKNLTCQIYLSEEGEWGRYDQQFRGGMIWNTGISPERIHLFSRRCPEDYVMSKTDTKFIRGASSAHCAFHLAYILGFDPIVIVGCDCKEEDGIHYFFEIEKQYSDYSRNPFQETNKILNHFRFNWKVLFEANPQIKFINCSSFNLFPEYTHIKTFLSSLPVPKKTINYQKPIPIRQENQTGKSFIIR